MSYALVVSIRIKPENVAAFMEKLEANASAARKEPGCIAFNVLVDPKDNTKVMLYEVYKSEAAFQEHQAQAPFKAYMEQALSLIHI